MQLYRFFNSKEHAEAFISGHVYISSLEACRNHEGIRQGDIGEGTEDFRITGLTGHGSDQKFKQALNRAGVGIDEYSHNIRITCDSAPLVIADAYLLCFTRSYDVSKMNSYGSYCVEVTSPKSLCQRITYALLAEGEKLKQVASGSVIYAERRYQDYQPSPGPVGFVKPVFPYHLDNEYRMLWLNKEQTANARVINCGDLRDISRLIF